MLRSSFGNHKLVPLKMSLFFADCISPLSAGAGVRNNLAVNLIKTREISISQGLALTEIDVLIADNFQISCDNHSSLVVPSTFIHT